MTKHSLTFILCAVLCLGFATAASAQDYPKRSVGGQDYYIYIVEPGNTLFGIARSFSVGINDLKKANPGAEEGLDIGQEVWVPINAIDRRQARRSDIRTDGAYLSHTVQRKETLFSIAKLYGVSTKDIADLNPEAVESLATGAVLSIPIQRSTTVKEAYLEPAKNDTFMVHQVQKGETLYSIAKSYDLGTDSLLNFNPGLSETLSVGTWIVVPKYNAVHATKVDSLLRSAAQQMYDMPTGEKARYNLTLALPFEVQNNDSIARSLRQGRSLGVISEIALEFYRGAMLALDSLERMGFNANVSVIDLSEDLVAARESIRRKELNEAHIIIGPMHKGSLAVISDMSQKNKAYLVSPNSFSNEVFGDNPYLFRANASRETMLKYLANYVAINHRKHNVLMVSSESPKDWPERKLFKQYYNEALGTFPNSYRDSVASVTKKNFNADNASTWLKKDTLNVLVLPTNELAFISDFMTRLITLERSGYRIQVYGLDQWLKFDNIEAEYKNRFKLRLVVPGYVDYNTERVIAFLEKYRSQYGTEPSSRNYGFQGFDLTMYFGMALMEHGLGFGSKTDEMDMLGVMGSYRFSRTSAGKDFENKSVLILEYNDFEIKRIN